MLAPCETCQQLGQNLQTVTMHLIWSRITHKDSRGADVLHEAPCSTVLASAAHQSCPVLNSAERGHAACAGVSRQTCVG